MTKTLLRSLHAFSAPLTSLWSVIATPMPFCWHFLSVSVMRETESIPYSVWKCRSTAWNPALPSSRKMPLGMYFGRLKKIWLMRAAGT